MNSKIPVTALIQTKNEERAIGACVDAAKVFDEVVVCDSHSGDKTVEIARAHGARVVDFAWNGEYPKKKQWQLDNVSTRHPWVLFLDADEAVDSELCDAVRQFVERPGNAVAGQVTLAYHFAGRRLRHGHVVRKTVLLKRKFARFPDVDDAHLPGMGELEGHYQPDCDGPVVTLKGRLDHNDPDPVATWFDRHNKYSSWEAHLRRNRELEQLVASKRTRRGQAWSKVPFKPLVFFLYSYVARAGFLDGRAGFDYAVALSTYYWQIGVKYRELAREDNDQ